ncbi:hypothetical protein KAV79_00320, partial [Candidatus Aerophobetes bacterium]|nr:hypothetical protein [Candidatus Aerophobetes bacterium]
VILLFENASGWKLWKIGRDSVQPQKPNSYIFELNHNAVVCYQFPTSLGHNRLFEGATKKRAK